jgi:ABC-type lipoprotein release transport system permease subunit
MVEAMGFGAPTWASVSSGIGATLQGVQWIVVVGLPCAPLMTMLAAWLPTHRAAEWSIVKTIRSDSF